MFGIIIWHSLGNNAEISPTFYVGDSDQDKSTFLLAVKLHLYYLAYLLQAKCCGVVMFILVLGEFPAEGWPCSCQVNGALP